MQHFTNNALSPTSPVVSAAPVTPSDTADLAEPCRGLHVAGAEGKVAYVSLSGDVVEFLALPGIDYPRFATRILATGTTASQIWALY